MIGPNAGRNRRTRVVQDVRDAEKQIDRGEGVDHETARRQLLSRLKHPTSTPNKR